MVFYTRKEVAGFLKVSKRTIDRLRRDGILPWVDLSAGRGKKPVVRFPAAAIENFLRANSKGVPHDRG